jgi:flavin-binding protein dodecin
MNAAHSPQRILLVEDDTVVRHVYSKMLIETRGCINKGRAQHWPVTTKVGFALEG